MAEAINSILQFIKEARQELKKVVWPSRKQTITSTSVVVIFVIVIAVFLGLVDLVVAKIVRSFLHY